jgi:hypothetical protein
VEEREGEGKGGSGGRLHALSAGRRGDEVVLIVLAGEFLERLALRFGEKVGGEDTGLRNEKKQSQFRRRGKTTEGLLFTSMKRLFMIRRGCQDRSHEREEEAKRTRRSEGREEPRHLILRGP